MAIYAYACPLGHEIERTFPMGKAAPDVVCVPHQKIAPRVFSLPMVNENDPFRSWWKSNRGAHAFDERAPHCYLPRDAADAKRAGEYFGRTYIGDDVSTLKPEAQAAIAERRAPQKKKKGPARERSATSR